MTFVIIGIAALFLWLFPALRCAVTHPFHCLYYAAKDGYKYIKYKQGNLRKTGNLDIFCGYFRSVYKELHADHETGAADNK